MRNTERYVTALYIRLSIEDSKVESLSIENQRRALHEYVEAMEIPDAEVTEFVDNGYSGTNFERPAVQSLLDAVRAGKRSCLSTTRTGAGRSADKTASITGPLSVPS